MLLILSSYRVLNATIEPEESLTSNPSKPCQPNLSDISKAEIYSQLSQKKTYFGKEPYIINLTGYSNSAF